MTGPQNLSESTIWLCAKPSVWIVHNQFVSARNKESNSLIQSTTSPSITVRAVFQIILAGVVVCICCAGCSRQAHRSWADRDAYRLLKSRQTDPLWDLPQRAVEPAPTSRLADVQDPDCGPVPPDDPAARHYMRRPYNSKRSVKYWDDRGEFAAVDSEHWLQHLPYNDEGEVELDKQLAVDMALLHNRGFQTQVEQLHSAALGLSANRFEYELNWFGGSDTSFSASGDGVEANRDLGVANQLGFNKNFASGAQLATNIANSFTWQLGGTNNPNFGSGNLLVNLTQPLLRGAFRHVRTESLTQAERNLLYSVRDFARFRRQFYLDIVSRYLDLLSQAQSLRNEEENLANLERNLDEHNLLLVLEKVSPIQVDQVFQNYQLGRLQLINSQQGFQTSLDQFKFQLGLPAKVKLKLDETILDPFQLNSIAIEELQQNAIELKTSISRYLPPEEIAPAEFLENTYEQLRSYGKEVEELKPLVDAEFKTLVKKLEASEPADDAEDAEKVDYGQQVEIAERIERFLNDLDDQITTASGYYEKELDDLDVLIDQPVPPGVKPNPLIQSWNKLETMMSSEGGLNDRITTLLVVQTQIRLFLIDLSPLKIESDLAIEVALENRLDLKNSRAAVVDAYRSVEIAADQLQSDLSVSASANLQSDPTRDNAFSFDGDENQYNVGVEFDGPLNRLGERNGYRNAQLAYQQQRRTFMAEEDAIVNNLRLNLRQLRTSRFSFQIARQQLITATRQVEESQINLRQANSADSSVTQDLLQALQFLRNNKNSLISSWIGYETSRIALFVDLELLKLDEQGVWVNERENFDSLKSNTLSGAANDSDSGESTVNLSADGEPENDANTNSTQSDARENERLRSDRNESGSGDPDLDVPQPAGEPTRETPALDGPNNDRTTDRRSWIRKLPFVR